MENFCWEWDVLQHMTAHADTGAALPRALFDKMIAAKNFQSGLQTLRQVEFSLFDMHVHYDYEPEGKQSVQDVLSDSACAGFGDDAAGSSTASSTRSRTSLPAAMRPVTIATSGRKSCRPTPTARSKKPARQMAMFCPATTGARFLREILAMGGSRPAIDSFKAFRGREPSDRCVAAP
jgi:oligopeptidase A